MKVVVITGSTRGIGFGLARSFLDQGYAVTLSGRTNESVERAMAKLAKKYPIDHILGCACDVRHRDQVETLWEKANDQFGQVDIWINNAGIGTGVIDFWDHPADIQEQVVGVNIIGLMHGCSVAIQGMLKQGRGFIYNMEGLGSDGRQVRGILLYGTTKYSLAYLTRGLVKELKGTPVKIGSLSPGMVITDLLMGDYDLNSNEWQKAKSIFNILADRVETVTPWLVKKMLSNDNHGIRINWLTTPKIIWRFLTARITRRNPFKDQ